MAIIILKLADKMHSDYLYACQRLNIKQEDTLLKIVKETIIKANKKYPIER